MAAALLCCAASCAVCRTAAAQPSGVWTSQPATRELANLQFGGPLGPSNSARAPSAWVLGSVPAAPPGMVDLTPPHSSTILNTTLPTGKSVCQSGQGPALQPGCIAGPMPDPVFSATTVAYMATDMRPRISKECFTIIVTSLSVCIPDLSLKQGCCSLDCSAALHLVGTEAFYLRRAALCPAL